MVLSIKSACCSLGLEMAEWPEDVDWPWPVWINMPVIDEGLDDGAPDEGGEDAGGDDVIGLALDATVLFFTYVFDLLCVAAVELLMLGM